MLRPRGAAPAEPIPGQPRARRDPLTSLTAFFLGVIAIGLFVAAILAVYTYSTPAVELPLVIALALAFSALLAVNIIGLALRQLRAGRL
jgi:hypothetical protein